MGLESNSNRRSLVGGLMAGIGRFPGFKIEPRGTPRLRDGVFQTAVPFLFYNRLNSIPGNCAFQIA